MFMNSLLSQLPLQVSGSYHFMPDESRYDNKAIESALRRSAVVIIGLSPSYLKSERSAALVGCGLPPRVLYQ